jgi:alpha-tubulin suppressor-like RCC1 family protein
MTGTRRQRRASVAFLLLTPSLLAAGALGSLGACSDAYSGKETLPLADAAPKKDGSGITLGDAVAVGEAGCGETVCMIQLALGGGFGCALGDDAVVRCWGDNDKGQTGAADPSMPTQTPRVVGGLGPVKQITTGTRHACALQVDGRVFCWGDDESGLVSGTPSLGAHPVPVEIPGLLLPVEQLVAVSSHQCALLAGGDLFCWGNNEYGQLGVANVDGGDPVKSIPRPTRALDKVVQVGGADETTCALRTSGEVSCFGRNFSGQLGNGTSDTNPHPAAVSVTGLISPVAQLTSSAGYHVGVTLVDGRVQAWGSNARSAIVPTASVFQLTTATQVAGATGVAEIAAGGYFTCARAKAGPVSCWGDASGGQGGFPSDGGPNTAPPREVPGTDGAEHVAAGRAAFACILASGKVLCWGSNDKGQLGRGGVGGIFPTPATLSL